VIFEFEAKLSKKGGIEKNPIYSTGFLPNIYKSGVRDILTNGL
jgi:hypothetical protein